MLIDEIQYADGELTVKLKPVFEALRLIKLYGKPQNESEKVRTLKKPLNKEVWEYLNDQVEQIVNNKVRTLETLIIPNKKAPEGADFNSGAGNGLLLDPVFMQLQNIAKSTDCQYCLINLSKLAA